MISSLDFVPNGGRRKALEPFVADEFVKDRLAYLQIPMVDELQRDAGEEAESDETIESDDAILFATPNTEECSTLSFHVYGAEEAPFVHHDLFVFSTILDGAHIRDGLVALATFESDLFVYDAFVHFPVLPQALLIGHSSVVTGVAQHDGRLASCSEDGRVLEWDLEKLVCREDLTARFPCVPTALADGEGVATNPAIERFDFDAQNLAFGALTYLNINGNSVALDAEIERITIHDGLVHVLDAAGQILVFDPRNTNGPCRTIKAHKESVFSLVWHGDIAATSSVDGTIKIWDKDFQETHCFDKKQPIYVLNFDQNGRLFSGNEENEVAEVIIA